MACGSSVPLAKTLSPKTCDFAIFVESFQTAADDLGYFQPDRVRTDVNRGECWHAMLDTKSISY